MGDSIQAAKAGILEIGDVFVVNKADRDGADATVRELRMMIALGDHPERRWTPPVVKTVASTSDGVEARYLVHPTYVEKLIALENAFAGQKIRTLFAAGELTVVLEATNMFESGSLDARRDRELVEACVNQFMSMAELVGALNEVRG